MTSIVIAEKSSARKNIEAAVGDKFGKVYASSGHLYCLVEPDEYGGDLADWRSFATLVPPEWKKRPTTDDRPGEQARLDKLRAELTKALKGADTVYLATDNDLEGELLGREILDENNFKGRVFRIIFTDEDPKSLQKAFSNPVPIEERENIYQAAIARERADYIWNLSLTRAATSALIPQGSRGVIGIGRVRSPTHAIVCRRELQIKGFKEAKTYSVKVTLDTPAGPLALSVPKESVYQDEDAANKAAKAIMAAGEATLTVETKKGKKAPPRPPSLAALQILASRWGWAVDKTLEVGQEVYSTAKIMTYVRGAVRYYPESMIENVPKILQGLAAQIPELKGIPSEPVIRTGKSGFFCDAALEGESHHALAPNVNTIDELKQRFDPLPEDQKRLYILMAQMFIQAVSPDEEFTAYSFKANLDIEDAPPLTATGRVQNEPGWKAVGSEQEDEDADDDQAASYPPAGTYKIIAAEAFKRASSPPQRYTQGTLLESMIKAWRFVQDPNQRERLKASKGIGTEATRGGIIRGLIEQGLMVDNKTLSPSEAGLLLFATLHKIDPKLVDPGTTANWENEIDAISKGKASMSGFVDEVAKEATRLVQIMKNCPSSPLFGELVPPTPAMKKAVEAIAKKGPKPPAGWKLSAKLAGEYLDKHAKPKAGGTRFPFIVPAGEEDKARQSGLKQDREGWFADTPQGADQAKAALFKMDDNAPVSVELANLKR